MPKRPLTVEVLLKEAAAFAKRESVHEEKSLFGKTDGKVVGTYLEQKFKEQFKKDYAFESGNSASGIDFPSLGIDIKTTSVTQPQSSCPYKGARQKIYGLGYGLLVFVYEKTDDSKKRTGRLRILHVIYVEANRTADFQTTSGLRRILENEPNKDDLVSFIRERNLPVDEIEAGNIADELLERKPELGYLTVSNALQWRLQYGRVIEQAGKVEGVIRLE